MDDLVHNELSEVYGSFFQGCDISCLGDGHTLTFVRRVLVYRCS